MISQRLKELRKLRQMAQADVAVRINVSREAYAMYETGRREPSLAILRRLADVFGVSADYLLERTEARGPYPMLSDEDLSMVRLFQQLDLRGRSTMLKLAAIEFSLRDSSEPEDATP